jgi:hypothetical protein
MWFRDGKGMSREAYAKMVTALIAAGAEQAMAATVEAEQKPERSAPRKSPPKPRSAAVGRTV